MNHHERFVCVIDSVSGGSRQWRDLYRVTGITADRWRASYTGTQRVAIDMIYAICKHWPQYALWLVTGQTETEVEQISGSTGKAER